MRLVPSLHNHIEDWGDPIPAKIIQNEVVELWLKMHIKETFLSSTRWSCMDDCILVLLS